MEGKKFSLLTKNLVHAGFRINFWKMAHLEKMMQ